MRVHVHSQLFSLWDCCLRLKFGPWLKNQRVFLFCRGFISGVRLKQFFLLKCQEICLFHVREQSPNTFCSAQTYEKNSLMNVCSDISCEPWVCHLYFSMERSEPTETTAEVEAVTMNLSRGQVTFHFQALEPIASIDVCMRHKFFCKAHPVYDSIQGGHNALAANSCQRVPQNWKKLSNRKLVNQHTLTFPRMRESATTDLEGSETGHPHAFSPVGDQNDSDTFLLVSISRRIWRTCLILEILLCVRSFETQNTNVFLDACLIRTNYLLDCLTKKSNTAEWECSNKKQCRDMVGGCPPSLGLGKNMTPCGEWRCWPPSLGNCPTYAGQPAM